MSGMLGLILLVTLGLLWRERKHKQSFRKDAHTWEGKYTELAQTQNVLVDIGGAQHQRPQQLDSWNLKELHGKQLPPPQLEGWRPSEMEGTRVS